MKKLKILSIPRNIPHASGVFLAKNVSKPILVIMALMITVLVVFTQGNDNGAMFNFFCLGIVLITTIFLFGYFSGRNDQKEIKKYLLHLKEKCKEQLNSSDVDSQIENLVNEEINSLKEKLKNFYNASLVKFVLIRTNEKGSADAMKKAMNALEKDIKMAKNKSLIKTGIFLQDKLYSPMVDAINDGTLFVFSATDWVEELDLSEEYEIFHENASYEMYRHRADLRQIRIKINLLIQDLPITVYRE